MTAIVWFRYDLRLTDNLALDAAVKAGDTILPLYIYDQHDTRPIGGAAKWWLHHSLKSLKNSFKEYKADLILREGDALKILTDIYNSTKFTQIYWHDRYDPDGRKQDADIKKYFENKGVECISYNGSLIFNSINFKTKTGTNFKVFTPFWKHCLKNGVIKDPIAKPQIIKFDHNLKLNSEDLNSWNLLPTKPNWAKGFEEVWNPGEMGAQKLYKEFLNKKLKHYKDGRDYPAKLAISDLSPHIHWGEISLRELWKEIEIRSLSKNISESQCFLRQLCWKEFNHYMLYHNPEMINKSLKNKFEKFPWVKDSLLFKAWTQGKTGYPLVDAGMRQLWKTGYMHNRVRLIVGSFLVKNLLISWKEGEEWFWDTLVDADLASNSFNWQWVAGCGTDSAPYFRVFNPILQSKKFDAKGEYIRSWVPELSKVSNQYIHQPWLSKNKIDNYPSPIVDYNESREQALETFYNLPK